MKRNISFGTLESRIYMIFTLMIFSAIFIMQLVSSRFTLNTVKNSALENSRVLLMQLTSEIDAYILGMEKISLTIQNDTQIQNYLKNPENENPRDLKEIQNRMQTYVRAREDISNILIVGPNNSILSGDPDTVINPWTSIKEKEWYTRALQADGKTVVSSSYVQDIMEGRYPWVVSLSKEIFSLENKQSLGVLLVDLKFNRINELCRSLVVGEKGYNFIVDNNGNYVFHPTQQLVYSNLRSEPIKSILNLLGESQENIYHDSDRYFMVETSELTGWHIVSVTHDSDIIPDWEYIQITYTIIGLILFLIVGFATNKISAGITKPVRKLQNIMKSVDTGEFQIVGSIQATDEIRELAREYDIMVGRIRELMAANTREQELKRKSDLKALQAQINPHFLYNTLDSIIWMAEMGQSKEVVHMTSALSKLFRISISKGKEFITLKDEIAHVESYLTIQKMRYKDKFKYIIDIDPSLYDLTILKIILQPLVENAIYHGIKEVDYTGMIKITGKRENDIIILKVIDNGKGMTEEELQDLMKGIETPVEKQPGLSKHGMGVRNVNERIHLYFGREYGLSFSSSLKHGTTITVKFPFKTQGDI